MTSERHTPWSELPIACPHCGNHGEPGGRWQMNAWMPFKLIEEVVRSFEFVAKIEGNGVLALLADVESDKVDWESGSNLRFECMQCFGQFPIPQDADVDFDAL